MMRRPFFTPRPATARDHDAFKRDVRKLKELGLTESLEVGYRIAPRGRTVLKYVSRPSPAKSKR